MNEDDRFGTGDALRAALDSHGRDNPVLRAGMYVPTRGEVATRAADELAYILDFWMWESPTELIPSRAQIADVRSILLGRPGAAASAVQGVISQCDDYLEE